MQGIERFVSHNFDEQHSTFNSCINLIKYAYLQLAANNKIYSRKEIQQIATKVRGKESKLVELEDFLRNDLIVNYIEPNRHIFGLSHYQFLSGVEEFYENIKIGILDIKVCSPLFNGNNYFIFECKRLNKVIIDDYINKGVVRFIDGQYYKASKYTKAGMISFLESKDVNSKIDIINAFPILQSALIHHKDNVLLEGDLISYFLECTEVASLNESKITFVSKHSRKENSMQIEIFHIVLDYNTIVVD